MSEKFTDPIMVEAALRADRAAHPWYHDEDKKSEVAKPEVVKQLRQTPAELRAEIASLRKELAELRKQVT